MDSDVPSRVVEVVSNAREDQSAVTGADIGADADTEMRDGIKEGLQVDSNEGRKEHRAVIIAALMALCNLVNDYAPFREVSRTPFFLLLLLLGDEWDAHGL